MSALRSYSCILIFNLNINYFTFEIRSCVWCNTHLTNKSTSHSDKLKTKWKFAKIRGHRVKITARITPETFLITLWIQSQSKIRNKKILYTTVRKMYKHVRGPVQVRHFLLNWTPMPERDARFPTFSCAAKTTRLEREPHIVLSCFHGRCIHENKE